MYTLYKFWYFLGLVMLGCHRWQSRKLYTMSPVISVCHSRCFSLWFFSFSSHSSSPPPCTLCLAAHFPLRLSPILLSSSPVCVWWTDVITSTAFIPPSSKEGRWLYLSSFSVFKRCLGHCSAPLPVWAELDGKNLVCIWQTCKLIVEITIFFPSLSVYFTL